jgi:CheY-like chemotaxis protein
MKTLVFVVLIPAIILFVVLNLISRELYRKYRESKQRAEREDALAESLRLDFTRESETLKRVEVEDPAARILCVDDEEVILDSLRKILVLDGYSVDTVETGQEALGLVQMRDYDFVFTDLKMPAMSGTDVAKSVKHLRPDIDVVIITGFATVDSAVECMKFGAMDYIEKPFTEDELRLFVKRTLIKRQDRIEKQLKPRVNIQGSAESSQSFKGEFTIPGGVHVGVGHCWASLSADGTAKIGMDDFASKLLGRIDAIDLPTVGTRVKAGDPLFRINQGDRQAQFNAPLSGKVTEVNNAMRENVGELANRPYGGHWVCVIAAEELDTELAELRIGKSAIAYFQEDLDRLQEFMQKTGGETAGSAELLSIGAFEDLNDSRWNEAVKAFF